MDANKIIEYSTNSRNNDEENNYFSLNRPRDLIAGVSSGIKNVGRGLFGGLCSLVVLPISGAHNEGFPGFLKGVSLGLAGSIILPISGTVTGSIQIIKGLINTPEAIKSNINGKIWNNETKKWIIYNLKEETKKILNETEEDFLSKFKKKISIKENKDIKEINKKVIETEYYEILEIPINSTQQEIKHSYRKLALKYHPDRNNEQDKTDIKFKKIGEAYQILGVPELRDKYDKMGKEGINNTKIMNSNQLYCFLFGNNKLKFFIGELYLSMILALEKNKPQEFIKFKQKKREIILANNILEFLKFYLQDDPKMKNIYNDKKNNLITNPFGQMIINLLGNLYIQIAQNFLGTFSKIFNRFKINQNSIVNKYKLAISIIKITTNNTKKSSEKINNLVDIILSITNIDIENTIRNVCFKILNDSSVSYKQRCKRAKGLLYIGTIFYKNYNKNQELTKKYLINKIN